MLIINLLLFLLALFVLAKSSEYCIKYSSNISKIFHLSEFIVSFFIVAMLSALPESSIAIVSAIQNVPQFGMGTLLGSNVADLALVFGIAALFSTAGITVKSQILKKDFFYLVLLMLPIILGLNGSFSRIDGIILVFGGALFFLTLSIESKMFRKKVNNIRSGSLLKNILLLVIGIAILLISASYTVEFGVKFAQDINIPTIIVALTAVSIGTCLPELMFSLKAVKTHHDQLALGDILGTVIIDATIILGIVAIINPFSFNIITLYVTGIAMFLAGLLAVIFIRTGKVLTKKEGLYLLLFYIAYLIVEFMVNQYF